MRLNETPTSLDELALVPVVRHALQTFSEGDCPNLLFYGDTGTGKSTSAALLLHQMDKEVIHVDATVADTKVALSGALSGLTGMSLFGKKKAVLLDEVDELRADAQKMLSGQMDRFKNAQIDILWMFTTNNPNKVNKRILSRCIRIGFDPLEWDEKKKTFKEDDAVVQQWRSELERIAPLIFKRSGLKFDARAKKALKETMIHDEYLRDVRRFVTTLSNTYRMSG
jgi:replication-associated recombination protein RarA